MSTISVTKAPLRPYIVGNNEQFTGAVRIDSHFQAPNPARIGGALVTFEPNARTNWHTHPLGQTLFITQGSGWVQEWGKEKQLIKQGDIVWIPENIKHWHGASKDTAMIHFAIAESLNNSAVNWLEPVSNEQYSKIVIINLKALLYKGQLTSISKDISIFNGCLSYYTISKVAFMTLSFVI